MTQLQRAVRTRRRLALALAVAALLLVPGAAGAQSVLTPNPAVLQADSLDGASITLQAPAGGRFGFAAALDNRWSASGAPPGVTVTVVTAAEPKLTHGRTRVNLVIRATGNSTRDWNLYIIGTNFAVDGSSGGVSFGPIRVQGPAPGVTLGPSAATVTRDLSVTEQGAAATYSVQLGQRPQGGVNVQIQAPAGISTNPSGMVFNASNWNTARTVTVRALDDANTAGETARIRHYVLDAQSSSDYRPAPDAYLTVHVADNDTPAIQVSQRGPMRLTEGGSSTYTVRLSHVPTGSVLLSLTSSDAGAVTLNGIGQPELTFTTQNWNTAQTVTVAAVHDGDLRNETLTIDQRVDPAGSVDDFKAAEPVTFAVNVTDDDGLRVVPRAVTVQEDSAADATYTVALKSRPSGPVTVTAAAPSGDATAVSVSPSELVFTTTNWSAGQAVTVTAGSGATDPDAADRTVTLSHAVASAGAPYNYAAQSGDDVTVTIDDDETAAVLLSRSAALALREGETATYTVRLGAPPAAGNVEVRVSSDDAAVTVNKAGGTAAAAQTLTFDASTWSTAQTVTVEAVHDANAAHATVTLTHAVVAASSADEYDDVAAVTLGVGVTDDEGAEIEVSRGTGVLALAETGATSSATYTVRLSVVPSAAVTVRVSSADSGAVTVNGAASSDLSFSTMNWSTGQAVTVTAVTDADATHERVTVRHAVSGGAPEYVATGAVTFPVTVADTNAGLSVTPRAVTVREGGTVQDTYTVALSVAPSGPVTVTASVASGDTKVALDTDASPQTRVLEFSTTNWNTPQTVTVRATSAADDVDGVNPAPVRITHAVASADTQYNYTERTTERVTVTIEDDETPGVRVSRLRMTLQEDPSAGGGTGRNVGTYTMVLTSGISGTGAAVGVRVRSQNRDAVRVRTDWDPFVPGSGEWRVIFSPTNWNVPQTVTVTAQSDPDGRDEEVVLINEYFAIDGNARNQGYINARGFVLQTPIPDTTVTVADDETPALVVDTDPGTAGVQTGALEVREGSTATAVYTVALGVVPTAAVTVSVNNGDSSAVTLSPPTLTFTTQNWETAQTVTATPVADDADGEHERVTVTHTLTGAVEYVPPALPASRVPGVTVAVTDDDAASARIYTSNPSPLVQGSLNGATVGVQVTNTTWAAGVQTTAAVDSYFALDTTVPGLTLGSIASVPTTGTATLNLAYDGTAFDTPRTLKVRVLAAAHAGSGNLVTGAAPVTPTPGLTIAPTTGLRTTESGGTATFTVRLATQPAGAVALTLASSNTDEGTVSPTAMTFAPSAWQTPQTVTLTGVDDDMATPPNPADGTQSYTITLTVDQANTADDTYDGMAPVSLTAYNQDNEFGLNVGSVSGQATEAGGTATFTVALQTQPTAAVTVAVASQDTSEGTASPPSLTFTGGATGNWGTAQTVTVTGVQDDVDDGDVTWQVRLDPASGDTNYNGLANVDVDVTTTDDDGAPGVTLALDPASVSENGGIATVTARLSRASEAATTVTVTPVSGAFTAGSGAAGVVVIAAGDTTSTDTALVTAVDNTTDAPDRTATVTATVANDRAAADSTTMTVTAATLTLTDDDAAPGATLALDPASIAEPNGVSTVSATLSRPSSEPSTLTVTAVSGAYTVGSDATITIAAGATTASSDTVLITAVDDSIHQGTAGRSATVTGALTNGQGAGAVTGASLTLTDDETLPTVALVLTPASISEEGGVAAVTATLSGPSSAAVTVTVAAAAGTGAVAADFDLSTATTLTIAAGSTTSAGTVTVTANGNAVASGNKQVTVSGTSTGGNSVANPANATLTITDDDTPQATLALSSASISENGGVATVTATLDRQSAAAVTVTVAAAAGANAAAGDFTLSTANTLTFAANATTSTGLVTVTAVNNATDAPDKSVTVSGTASDSQGLTNNPPDMTLAITDDDAAPGVVLALNPSSVSENVGISTVSATLSHPSSQPSTVTVTAVSGFYTVGSDATITIAAGATTAASDTVLVTAVDDAVHQGTAGRSVTVTATLANGQGAGAVTGAALTLTDDETLPTASLALTPASVSENGGVATVMAALSGPSSQPVTVTVGTAPVATSGAVAADFTQTGTTLTVAAGATTSTGAVTVRANDNAVDSPDKSVTVSATAAGGNSVANPSNVTLTLTDDEATATATLVLTPSAILENGEVSMVTARLSHPTTEATTLTVSSAPVAPAVAGDFTPSATTTLTIAAGGTTSTGLVTVTAVDNNDASGRKRVTVSATAAGGHGVANPADATLIIRDDEFGLDESAVTGQATEGGGTATFTVALQTQPSASVSVAVTSRDADGNPDTTEGRVSPSSLVFTVQNWETAQTVTVTGADDDVDDGDVAWKVRLEPSSGDVNYDGLDPVDVDVSTTDNDAAPTVTLVLSEPDAASPDAISENDGVSTVTATLSHPSGADTTVTVTAAPVSPATEDDYTLSTATTLTIAAGNISSGGVVTIRARDNHVDAPNKMVTVSAGTPVNDRAEADGTTMTVTDATLTIVDDDEKGLVFTPAAVVEVGEGARQARYTVHLNSKPTGPVTVALTTDGAVQASPETLTFTTTMGTMGSWDTAQTVTATVGSAVGADGYAAALSVAHAASGGDYGGGDGVTGTMSVSVAGATRIRIAGADTTTTATYGVAGRRVTVTVESGTPAGIEVDLEGVGAGPPLALTVSPEVAAATVAEAAGDGFGGLAEALAAARTVVDISVTTGSVPSSGVEICLPVSAGLRAAAAGVRDGSADRALLLLRHDGSAWAEAGEEGASSYDADRMHVCASGVASFSPFAVGYKDAAPSFEEDFPEAFVWDVDEEIEPVTLPAATGDGTIEYALSPALPEGVERDGRQLSGTPTAEMGVTDYVWTATDADEQVARLEFTIEVVPALDKARARLAAINRSVLPELSRATWGSVVEAVTGRLESSVAGSGMADTLASALKAREGAQDESGVTWRDVVEGRTFTVALGGDGSGADGGAGGGGGAAGGAGAVMWGGGSRRSLSLDKGPLDWSGDVFAAHVGVDAPMGGSLRGGLAASWIEGEIEYTDRSGDEAVTGVHVSRLAAVHPYAGWTGSDGSRLWGALGYGEGEIEIVEAEVVERFGVQKGDSAFVGVAVGGSVPVVSADGLVLSLKGSGEATRYSVEDNGSAIAAVSVDTQRLRLAAEARRMWALSGGGTLTPSLEVGARWDGGDGETGAGMELGGGLEWSLPSRGLSVEARGRTLVAHEGDVEEWGVSGSARLSPGSGGRGLSLSLSPRWGAAESGLARLWDEGMTGRASSGGVEADDDTVHLDAEVGYGIGFWEGSGLATPHAGIGYGSDGERHYRLGTRFEFGPDVAVGLRTERKESAAAPEHGARLELRLRW